MAKEADFAGLPQNLFVTMVADLQTGAIGFLPAHPTAGVDLLAAVAKAEHAAARSSAVPNVADYVFACLAVRDAFNDLKTNGDDAGGVKIGGLQAALTALQNLFP
jgi:hypothetical protein